MNLFDAFCSNGALPLDVNNGPFTFLMKDEKGDDKTLSAEGIFRHPCDLRPLT